MSDCLCHPIHHRLVIFLLGQASAVVALGLLGMAMLRLQGKADADEYVHWQPAAVAEPAAAL